MSQIDLLRTETANLLTSTQPLHAARYIPIALRSCHPCRNYECCVPPAGACRSRRRPPICLPSSIALNLPRCCPQMRETAPGWAVPPHCCRNAYHCCLRVRDMQCSGRDGEKKGCYAGTLCQHSECIRRGSPHTLALLRRELRHAAARGTAQQSVSALPSGEQRLFLTAAMHVEVLLCSACRKEQKVQPGSVGLTCLGCSSLGYEVQRRRSQSLYWVQAPAAPAHHQAHCCWRLCTMGVNNKARKWVAHL